MSEPPVILGVEDLDAGASDNGRVAASPAVAFDNKGKPALPERPEGDRPALAAWVTVVFALDPQHPIIMGRHFGSGTAGMVELERLDAPTITFDPASHIAKGDTLLEALIWQTIDSDGEPFAWSKPQAQKIAGVVARLCQHKTTESLGAMADLVVTTLLQVAVPVEGRTTYGTGGQRFEAGVALTAPLDDHGRPEAPRYLVEKESGELVIRVSDAQRVARQLYGSLRRGWLDGVFEAFGWRRIILEGYELRGRDDRTRGRHHRSEAYRGRLPEPQDEAR